MSETLTIGSLFSGIIGGLELGLERSGLGPVLWQVELDPFARAVLTKHWPQSTRYEDVRTLGPELAPVDVLCGGFPCTDISNAGRREGIGGEHSGLWREFARLIRLLRPRAVVVENVAALLARGAGTVFGDLAACGYDAEWDCVPAAAVGAPHRRDRLFVLAWLSDSERDGGGQQSEWGLREQTERWHASIAHVGAGLADAAIVLEREADEQRAGDDSTGQSRSAGVGEMQVGQGLADSEIVGCGSQLHGAGPHEDAPRLPAWPPAPGDMHAWGRVPPLAQPSICRLADGLPVDLVRGRRRALKCYGNAVVPAVAEVIGRRLMEIMGETSRAMVAR